MGGGKDTNYYGEIPNLTIKAEPKTQTATGNYCHWSFLELEQPGASTHRFSLTSIIIALSVVDL